LIAHTILPAIESRVFARVIVSTDCPQIADEAIRYGAEVPFMRPVELAEDLSPDIDWVLHAISGLGEQSFDAFAILRPTSPFRTADTFLRARELFCSVNGADSLRAVEPCRQHPGKMWKQAGELIEPFLDDGGAMPPWHSSATQSLPLVLAQNASFEIAWTRVPLETGTIAGSRVVGFLTQGHEGFDINSPSDLVLAEALLERGLVQVSRRR
jgi:N-acylneuraminate cytidylyltransferase